MAHSYEDVYYASKALADCQDLKTETGYKIVYGTISGMLFHSVDNFSGLISESADALRRENSKYKPTKEHYYSRAKKAREILSAISDGVDKETVIELIKESCSIHYTTKDENTALAQLKDMDYPATYEHLNIKLIPYVKLSQKYVYFVEGVEYNSTIEIAAKYNICSSTVLGRCNKDTFPNWIKKEVNNDKTTRIN